MNVTRKRLKNDKRSDLSAVTSSFLANYEFLKRFLSGFFSEREEIEDVAQETYLRAYVAEQMKAIEQPKAYLFRTARNIALTELTKKSRKITDYLEEAGVSTVPDNAAGADSEAEAEELLGMYCEAVAQLPEKCRQVFLLRKVHGLSHRDIAVRMALSVSSVEKYLHTGIVHCKTYLQRRDGRLAAYTAARSVTGQRSDKQ